MTSELQAKHHARRRRDALVVIENCEHFKVCCQCNGIAYKKDKVCPLCHCYRWWENPEAVIMAADLASRHPFPIHSATVPRIDFPIDEKPALPHIV